jgi:hypothetical protein
MVVKMDDGAQVEYGPGDAFYMPPGHDAWIVGETVCDDRLYWGSEVRKARLISSAFVRAHNSSR